MWIRSSGRGCTSAHGCSASPRSSGGPMPSSLAAWFRRQSVARKLTTNVLITSTATLVAACAAFAVYDYSSARARLVNDVTTIADVVGVNSTAALTFNDAHAAGETLQALSVNDHILGARLFDLDGAALAVYVRGGAVAARRGGAAAP